MKELTTRSGCAEAELALAERGDVARAPGVLEHVAGCPDCAELARALDAVDRAFPALARSDASEALVARTLAAVGAEAASPAPAAMPDRLALEQDGPGRLRRAAETLGRALRYAIVARRTSLATVAAVVLLVVVLPNLGRIYTQKRSMSDVRSWSGQQPQLSGKSRDALHSQAAPAATAVPPVPRTVARAAKDTPAPPVAPRAADTELRLEVGAGDGVPGEMQNGATDISAAKPATEGLVANNDEIAAGAELGALGEEESVDAISGPTSLSSLEALGKAKELTLDGENGLQDAASFADMDAFREAKSDREAESDDGARSDESARAEVGQKKGADLNAGEHDRKRQEQGKLVAESRLRADKNERVAAATPAKQGERSNPGRDLAPSAAEPVAQATAAVPANGAKVGWAGQPLPYSPNDAEKRFLFAEDGQARAAARQFLASRSVLEGLRFEKPSGEFANTYLPGDPTMRLLAASLREAAAREGALLPLPAAYRQPFDAPGDAAIAIDVHGDRRAVTGPTRMIVQVGLRATQRQAGVRPAMGVAVVLDLRGALSPEAAAEARALLSALVASRQSGDRMSLWVANRAGGQLVAPDDFRNGPVEVAMDRTLAGTVPAGKDVPVFSLPLALERALAPIAGDAKGATFERSTAAPGTGAVLLVTAGSLGADARPVGRIAHAGAVAGVPLSVIALGAGVPLDEAQRVALAGQGSLRVVSSPAEAGKAVEAELHASSRIVARALRLKVKLAPGVKLVSVLGSRRLGRIETRRVREAEKAEDRRLSKALGIASDRDLDEDAIRIAIPAFYAGDTHVVLLDVVTDRPGPVADVSLKYKDLVELRNHVAAAGIAVESGSFAPGPLEARVLKNAAALEVAASLTRASSRLRQGDAAAASAELARARALVLGLGLELPALRGDADLRADAALLATYERLLASGRLHDPALRARAAAALRFGAHLRTSAALATH